MLKPTKILVPTDFSVYSDKALEQALDISEQYNSAVYLLHVVHPTESGGIECPMPGNILQELQERAHDDAVRRVREQLDKFPRSKEAAVSVIIVEGTPRQAILDVAEERNIDLIVIASLGQSGIAKYLIGSVARAVLRGSKCPVLLTK